MASKKVVGAVTVTYNSASVLTEFLCCMTEQSYSDFLLFAVDNASMDASVSILRESNEPRLRVIANPDNLGVAAGNNQGIRAALEAGCASILLINNDTKFGPELITELVRGISTHEVQMSCPKIMYYDRPDYIWAAGGRFQRWAGYRALHRGEHEIDRGQYDVAGLVTYVPTCCVLIEARVFEQVGLMDERYFVYVDDQDFMYRALKAGVKLQYLPEVKLFHKVGSLTGGEESTFELRYGTRNRAFFLLKHFGLPLALPLLFARAFYFLCKSLVAGKGINWLRIKEIALWNALRMYADSGRESRTSRSHS